MVLVSVLMASYNHEHYIGEAIESVLNQSFDDLELVIIDDCSTDNSKKVIENYQAKDKRIRAVIHDKNEGIAKTANDSIKEAKGKFISFLASDDVWFPFKLEKQVKVLQSNDDKIVWSDGEIINSAGFSTGQSVTQRMQTPPKRSGYLFQELLKEDIIFGQSVILRTEYAQQIGFDESFRYVNDHLFFVNLSRDHEFYFVPEILAKYRVHGSNVSLKNHQVWFKERILLRKHLIEKFGHEMSPESLCDIYYKMGHALSGLGEKEAARHFYLKAIRTAPLHSSSALFLILALTNGEGFLGTLLSDSYQKVISVIGSNML
jgi:glycosyltransferase involved in cell wall biosynthesis